MRKDLLNLCVLTMFFCLFNIQIAQAAVNWGSAATMPTVRSQLTTITGADGRIYTFGGLTNNGAVSTVEIFDPSTNTWATGTSMLYADRGCPGALAADGRIHLFGGVISEHQIYDPISDSWSLGAVPLVPVSWWGGATAVVGGNIYLIGGEAGDYDQVQIYDPGTDSWSSGTSMPTPRLGMGVFNYNGLIYVIGGFNSANNAIGILEIYNPITDTWVSGASMPTLRGYMGIAFGPGSFYVIGGYSGVFTGVNEIGTVTDDRLYLIGGSTDYLNQEPPYLDTVESYDPISDTWYSETPLPTGRRALGAANASSTTVITPTAIPTLSEWGMIIMSLMLAGSAFWMIRRRQVS